MGSTGQGQTFPSHLSSPLCISASPREKYKQSQWKYKQIQHQAGCPGRLGQDGQQPVLGVRLREGNTSRHLTAKMAQVGPQTSQEASARPRRYGSSQPGLHRSRQPPALRKSLTGSLPQTCIFGQKSFATDFVMMDAEGNY